MRPVLAVLGGLIVATLVLGSVAASGAPPDPKKVTICHWTGKKYVKVNVGARALTGHMQHGQDVVPAPAACPSQAVSAAKNGGRPLTATLTGAAEVPGPGDPNGTGTATLRLNHGQAKVCFVLSVSNISLPATLAHIHVGGSTTFGPPVVTLTPPGSNGLSAGCVNAARSLIKQIRTNPSNYYVNVHTTDFPNGAIRGQL